MKHELIKVLYAAYDIQEFKPCKAFHRESIQKNISIDLSFPCLSSFGNWVET